MRSPVSVTPIGRMQCDHKPMMWRKRLDLAKSLALRCGSSLPTSAFLGTNTPDMVRRVGATSWKNYSVHVGIQVPKQEQQHYSHQDHADYAQHPELSNTRTSLDATSSILCARFEAEIRRSVGLIG